MALISGGTMATQIDETPAVGRHLTSVETVELARIQKDPSVIGYAVMDLQGNQIEAGGIWSSQLSPVFANVFDMSEKLGGELGEDNASPLLFFESPDFEVAGIMLTSCAAIILKRKKIKTAEGLRSVS